MKRFIIIYILISGSIVLAQREAFVVNSLAETLSLIDLETGNVTNHITTLGETPNQVAYYDSYLYVVNSISSDVMKINLTTHQVVHDFLLPIGSNPYNITLYGGYGYVTGWVSGKVYRLNLSQNTVDGELEVGGFPEGLICHENYLYVTRTNFNPDDYSYGQGKIVKIDLSDFLYVTEYNVGKNPQWISLAPDGSLNIVCTGNYVDIEGSVYIFEPGAGAIVDSILIGGQPSQLAISSSGVGYLSAGGWVTGGYIYAYDIYSGAIINGPGNPIMVGLGATAIASDSSGYIYSCNFGDDTVSKIDLSGTVVGTYNMGDGPISIAIIDNAPIGVSDQDYAAVPELPYLKGSYPNPFNGGTVISLGGKTDPQSLNKVNIYDITGRLLKVIDFETFGAGTGVYWDGRDRDNRPCASGIYFAKLETGEAGYDEEIRRKPLKMTIIR